GCHLEAADSCAIPGSFTELRDYRVTSQFGRRDGIATELAEFRLLFPGGRSVDAFVDRVPELVDQFLIQLRRALAGYRADLARQQCEQYAVFVGGPHGAVFPQEARAGRLLPAERDAAVDQPRYEPFEPDRN